MSGREIEIVAAVMLAVAFVAALTGFTVKSKLAETLGRANGEQGRLLQELRGTEFSLKVGQPMRGGGQGLEPPSPCPMCSTPVTMAHEVQLIRDVAPRPMRGSQYLTTARATSVEQSAVVFGPCGCRWETRHEDGHGRRTFDLVCTQNGPGGFQFALTQRTDGKAGEIVRRFAGATDGRTP